MQRRKIKTNAIDMSNPDVTRQLHIDLKRMREMKHRNAPIGANCFDLEI